MNDTASPAAEAESAVVAISVMTTLCVIGVALSAKATYYEHMLPNNEQFAHRFRWRREAYRFTWPTIVGGANSQRLDAARSWQNGDNRKEVQNDAKKSAHRVNKFNLRFGGCGRCAEGICSKTTGQGCPCTPSRSRVVACDGHGQECQDIQAGMDEVHGGGVRPIGQGQDRGATPQELVRSKVSVNQKPFAAAGK